MRKIGVEGHAVPGPGRARGRRRRGAGARRSRPRSLGCPGSCIGGSPGRRWTPPERAWSETSARSPGSGGVSTSYLWPCPPPPRRRSAARTTAHAVALVEAQQLGQGQLEPAGDPLGHRKRRARLATLDLGEHRRGDAGALGQVAQREVHPVAQAADAATERVAVDRHGVRYHVRSYVATAMQPSGPASSAAPRPRSRTRGRPGHRVQDRGGDVAGVQHLADLLAVSLHRLLHDRVLLWPCSSVSTNPGATVVTRMPACRPPGAAPRRRRARRTWSCCRRLRPRRHAGPRPTRR